MVLHSSITFDYYFGDQKFASGTNAHNNFDRVENMGKEENTGYQHFMFSDYVSKGLLSLCLTI